MPDGTPETEQKIRRAIVHLHRQILGRSHPSDHPEVDRTYRLFAAILADAKEKKGIGKEESYFCGARKDPNKDAGQKREDPTYAVRAWRGVVTYLLRQDDFLYE